MKKNNYLIYGIYVLMFAIYSLLVFFVFRNYNSNFWISYGFTVGSLLVHIFELTLFMRHKENNTKFTGMFGLVLTGGLVLVSVVIGLIFMITKSFISVKPVVLIHSIILIVQIIMVLIGVVTKTSLQDSAESRKSDVVFIKGITVEIEMLVDRCKDAQLKKELGQLKEVVEYSDPRSNSYVEKHEENILVVVGELKNAIDDDNVLAKELCAKLKSLFVERNKILLSTK